MASNKDLNLLSHHAYYLIGSEPLHIEVLLHLEQSHSIRQQANPDFYNRAYETFVIDDAREVKTFHGMRPVTEVGKKIFVLRMNGITVEAQNALLKLLEEPAEYAHFFIIIPSVHLLLPTVKSRMQELQIMKNGDHLVGLMDARKGGVNEKSKKNADHAVDSELLQNVRKLLSLSKAKRLEEVKKLIDEIAKDKKTKQHGIDLLDALQAVVYKEKGIKEGRSTLETIEMARNYMHDRAPSVKMLLEYVVLNV